MKLISRLPVEKTKSKRHAQLDTRRIGRSSRPPPESEAGAGVPQSARTRGARDAGFEVEVTVRNQKTAARAPFIRARPGAAGAR